MMGEADLILYNGRVHTIEPSQPVQQAVAIVGDRIVAVGQDGDLRAWKGPHTELLDLRGRPLIPGLIDGHVHFGAYAQSLQRIDLAEVDSLPEVVRRVATRAATAAPGEWLLGWGWNHNLWAERRFPRKEDVDHVTGDHPMALRSKDGHVAWVNSAALRLAHIDRDTPDPAGGEIERDPATGEPTGILKETAEGLLSGLIPPVDLHAMQSLLRQAFANAQSWGLTGVHNREGADELAAFQEMMRRGEMGLRVYTSIPAESLNAAIALGVRSGFGNKWLRLGGVKLFCDGALGARTADMLEPYEDEPQNRGIEVTSSAALRELIGRAACHGIHATIHAIGDRANRDVLDIFESVKAESAQRRLRHRIEHAQLLHPEDVRRFADLGVVASMQPVHILTDIPVAERHWGRRSRWAYAFRSLSKSGAMLAFGSDAPVEAPDPIRGIYAAVARKQLDGTPDSGWYPEERMTVEETVRAYTAGAAMASADELTRGTLARGSFADMTILSRDIFSTPAAEILDARAAATVIAGQFVFREGI